MEKSEAADNGKTGRIALADVKAMAVFGVTF